MTDKELLDAALMSRVAPNLNKLSQVLGYTQPSTLYTVMNRGGNLSQSKRLRLEELINEKQVRTTLQSCTEQSLGEVEFALRIAEILARAGATHVAQAIVNEFSHT